jgi:hypothetical protein
LVGILVLLTTLILDGEGALVPSKTVLLVLAVREPGLRSILAAQLSLPGVDLVTAQDVDGPALRRSVRRPAVLVVDAATVEERSTEWLNALLAEPHWRCIMVVTRGISEPCGETRLEYIDKSAVPKRICELLPVWLAEDPE